jgi:hypothetical protein
VRRFWIPAAVAAFALVAGGQADGTGTRAQCAQQLPHGPGLPAPVVVTTRCGRFRLEPNGDVVYKGPRTSPVSRVADVYWPQDLTWAGFTHDRHLLIGRGLKRLWRSHETYRRDALSEVVLGANRLSFSYSGRLYLARYGAPERVIARGENPVAFLSGRLVTWRKRGWALLLRGAGRVVVPHAVEPQWDRESGMVVFRTGHRLRVFDGARVRELADRYELGVRGTPVVEPLGRFVAIHDRRRIAIVGYEGRVVASAPVPKGRARADGISSSIVPNASATAVAFTATHRPRGVDTVYVLAAGTTRALARFDVATDFPGCGYSASVAWHGSWLLYANADPAAAVVDSRGQAPAVRLDKLISELPGVEREGIFNIDWAPAP